MRTTRTSPGSDGFTVEEWAAMKQRAEELRAEGKKGTTELVTAAVSA